MSSWEGKASPLRAHSKHGRQHEAWKRSRFAALRQEGHTVADISIRLGVSTSTLQEWARQMRITKRRGRPRSAR